MSSPLRRAIQTASLAFGPTIRRQDVPYLLVPLGQEISDLQCDIGHSREELENQLPALFRGQDIDFDISKIDFSLLENGWNTKVPSYTLSSVELKALQKEPAKANGSLLPGWCICYGSCDAHETSCSPKVMALSTLRAQYSLRHARRFPSLFN